MTGKVPFINKMQMLTVSSGLLSYYHKGSHKKTDHMLSYMSRLCHLQDAARYNNLSNVLMKYYA